MTAARCRERGFAQAKLRSRVTFILLPGGFRYGSGLFQRNPRSTRLGEMAMD